jgi:hypothetical protein
VVETEPEPMKVDEKNIIQDQSSSLSSLSTKNNIPKPLTVEQVEEYNSINDACATKIIVG